MKTGISSYTNIPHKSLFFIYVLYWSNYQFSPAYDILVSLPTPIWRQKGGVNLDYVFSFIVAVMAGVVYHYIIKWLDSKLDR